MLRSQLYEAWECGYDLRWMCLECQLTLYRGQGIRGPTPAERYFAELDQGHDNWARKREF